MKKAKICAEILERAHVSYDLVVTCPPSRGLPGQPTIVLFDVVASFSRIALARVVLEVFDVEHRHDPVEEAVDDFEAGLLPAVEGGDVTDVAGFALGLVVLYDDVRDLKDLHRQGVLLVLSDRLEQSWEQRGSHDLVFGRLWVLEDHCGLAVVLAIQPGKVLIV